jgi:hypothetical protein
MSKKKFFIDKLCLKTFRRQNFFWNIFLTKKNIDETFFSKLHFTRFLKISLYAVSGTSLYTFPEDFALRTLSRDFQ